MQASGSAAIIERLKRADPKGEYIVTGPTGYSFCPEGRHASVLQRWSEGICCYFCQLVVAIDKDEMIKR
jgi:hypothetical protein